MTGIDVNELNNGESSSSIIITYEHINGAGRLFGGRLAEWVDIIAGITARRYSRSEVTTAAMDINYSASASAGEVLTLSGKVVQTGKTSMIVRVNVFKEKIDGEMCSIGRAHLIFVSIDNKGKPLPVKKYVPLSDDDKAETRFAERFAAMKRCLRELS